MTTANIPTSRFQSINFPSEQGVEIIDSPLKMGDVSNQLISLASREDMLC